MFNKSRMNKKNIISYNINEMKLYQFVWNKNLIIIIGVFLI